MTAFSLQWEIAIFVIREITPKHLLRRSVDAETGTMPHTQANVCKSQCMNKHWMLQATSVYDNTAQYTTQKLLTSC